MRVQLKVRPTADWVIDVETRSRLWDIANDASVEERVALNQGLAAAASAARAAAGHWSFEAPSKAIDDWISAAFPDRGSDDLTRIRKAVVASLALTHFEVEDRLPPSIAKLYPAFFDRFARFLSNPCMRQYKADFYRKDVRYALGLTVPCGLLQADLRYRIGPKLVLRDIVHSRSLLAGWDYISASAWGRWYNVHIDTREMRQFNLAGWTASFSCIAEMLEINRSVCGTAATSWYHDPVVGEISPDLAYLRRNQLENGAFSLWLGSAPHHTKNAIYGSPVRQRLYTEGRYLPSCYLIAWPRQILIAWAQSRCAAANVPVANPVHRPPITVVFPTR